ncbi:MAG TPA: hypothetical protein VHC70_10430 [Phycisphaerales bacterium]|jgi:hypothetical protein|nr:hypothetical protein [Phycisphaerales bacterium]
MRHLLDTLGGLYQLARLACLSHLNFKSPYWQWRLYTAFGSGELSERPLRRNLHTILEYGRWVHRMRRGL